MKVIINRKNNALNCLPGEVAFMLGQAEGQFIEALGKSIGKNDNEIEAIIWASTSYQHTKSPKENYETIFEEERENDAKWIANYLCAVNWMSHFYLALTKAGKGQNTYGDIVIKKFHLESISKDYYERALCHYSDAYDKLNSWFYADKRISDDVKREVCLIND